MTGAGLIPVEGSPNELGELRQLAGSDAPVYWSGRQSRQLQSRLATLVGDPGYVSPPRAVVRASNASLTDIRALMKDDRSAYWSGPHSAALQARAVELLASDAYEPAGRPTETAKQPDDIARIDRIYAAADAALLAIDDESTRSAFLSKFEALPLHIQGAIGDELAADAIKIRPADHASAKEVEEFRATVEGPKLIEAWGEANAPRRLAVVRSRMNRLLNTVSHADQEIMLAFWADMTGEECFAVEWALSLGT